MPRSHLMLVSVLLLALICGMGVYAYLRMQESNTAPAEQQLPVTVTEGEPDITLITAKHYFTDPPGVHTLAGELPVSNTCDLLTYNAVLLDNGTRALVSFDVVNNASTGCEEKVVPQRFKVGFSAPRDIRIEAVYKGKPVELNLIPAKEGENPSDFEMQIKG